jgi:hypothetical protein
MKSIFLSLLMSVLCAYQAIAEDAPSAEEMARKLQDPLANIKALMTDNGVEFRTGNDEVSYSFQLQPVYAIPFEEQGFNLILRGIIPILGLAPEAQKPIVGDPLPPGDGLTWGLSDTVVQMFFSPKSDQVWKWGVGPMVSLKTRTDSNLAGAGWGAGPAAVLVGGVGDHVSVALLGGHLWGDESGFSSSILQPIVYYNFPAMPSANIHYNNTVAYNWNTTSGNAWTVPLGAGLGKTVALSGGHGLEFSLGAYYNVVKPDGAADWMVKWAVNWLLP